MKSAFRSFKHLLEPSGQKGTRLISQSNAAAAAHKPGRHFFKEKLFSKSMGLNKNLHLAAQET